MARLSPAWDCSYGTGADQSGSLVELMLFGKAEMGIEHRHGCLGEQAGDRVRRRRFDLRIRINLEGFLNPRRAFRAARGQGLDFCSSWFTSVWPRREGGRGRT